MQMTSQKVEVSERDNFVSEGDLFDTVRRLDFLRGTVAATVARKGSPIGEGDK
jgi:hypothetical protein